MDRCSETINLIILQSENALSLSTTTPCQYCKLIRSFKQKEEQLSYCRLCRYYFILDTKGTKYIKDNLLNLIFRPFPNRNT